MSDFERKKVISNVSVIYFDQMTDFGQILVLFLKKLKKCVFVFCPPPAKLRATPHNLPSRYFTSITTTTPTYYFPPCGDHVTHHASIHEFAPLSPRARRLTTRDTSTMSPRRIFLSPRHLAEHQSRPVPSLCLHRHYSAEVVRRSFLHNVSWHPSPRLHTVPGRLRELVIFANQKIPSGNHQDHICPLSLWRLIFREHFRVPPKPPANPNHNMIYVFDRALCPDEVGTSSHILRRNDPSTGLLPASRTLTYNSCTFIQQPQSSGIFMLPPAFHTDVTDPRTLRILLSIGPTLWRCASLHMFSPHPTNPPTTAILAPPKRMVLLWLAHTLPPCATFTILFLPVFYPFKRIWQNTSFTPTRKTILRGWTARYIVTPQLRTLVSHSVSLVNSKHSTANTSILESNYLA